MDWTTADLHDAHPEKVCAVAAQLRAFGTRRRFHGPAETLRVHDDNALVRATLGDEGAGRVLVIDGRASHRVALIGDRLAALGRDQGWSGAVVWGCIRDAAVIDTLDFGIRALGTTPIRSGKNRWGERGVPVTFGDVTIAPGDHLYVDEDGVLISEEPLLSRYLDFRS